MKADCDGVLLLHLGMTMFLLAVDEKKVNLYSYVCICKSIQCTLVKGLIYSEDRIQEGMSLRWIRYPSDGAKSAFSHKHELWKFRAVALKWYAITSIPKPVVFFSPCIPLYPLLTMLVLVGVCVCVCCQC